MKVRNYNTIIPIANTTLRSRFGERDAQNSLYFDEKKPMTSHATAFAGSGFKN